MESRHLAALFVVGAALFYSPLLNAFNRVGETGGAPILVLYLFSVWGALIFVAWVLTWGRRQ